MKSFDAVVIGAGPGGYPTAIRLAQLGKKTAIIEKENFGGVCLNVGCIPSKALIYGSSQFWKMKNEAEELGITAKGVDCDLGKMQDWKQGVVKKLTTGVQGLLKANGVEIIKGTAVFKDKQTLEVTSSSGKEAIGAKHIVIATGSRVAEIPTLPFNGKNVLSSTEALSLRDLPSEMVVVGGGFIGIEIGTVYAKLGSKVTIVEAFDQLLSTVDSELVSLVQKKMKHFGINVFTGAKALGIKEKEPLKAKKLSLEIETKEKTKQTLSADVILVSVGRKPNSDNMGLEKLGIKMDPRGNILTNNQSLTNVANIYAIGDVAGAPQLAHRATMDGLLVADTIAGKNAFKDYKTVPWAVFCDPEIAVAGLTEKEAVEKGFKVKVGRFPFAASGKALAMNESEGMAKIVIDEKSEAILGVHIVGPEASNLIAEAALAIEMGATVEDLVRTIHTHPTLPEVMPEAVEAAFYKAIHIYKPKRG
ncbi:MAG: dihydrolipoyl dehydrogenase [Proteobacteria bacterium]|nr:dihydrolipoyl dehydrogenase [Pseudomonadota bacterium]NBY18892.1 dihydrolipoyl dehydrogenase [bacterium]